MSDDKTLLDEIAYLVLLSVGGQISDRQFERLESLLKTVPQAREYYFSLHHVFLGLQQAEQCAILNTSSEPGFDSAMWIAMAENEKTAESIHVMQAKDAPAADPVKPAVIDRNPYTFNKTSLITAIVSIAALIMMITFFPMVSREPVATIADAMHVQWSGSTDQYGIGDTLFRSSEPLELSSGMIKMKFQCGTEAVLEGPAVFSCIAGGNLKLYFGKVYVQVPHGAEGFAVQTTTSKIIDLGTEFGVEARTDGNTSFYMYKGKASLITHPNGNQANSVILGKGMACHADYTGNVSTIPFIKTAFVRLFDSKRDYQWRGEDVNFNLADVAGGGDGLGSGLLDKGISLSDGAMKSDYKGEGLQGTGDYIPVPGSPFVDGVFVPVSSNEPIQISSQGHIFKECPKTTGRFYTVLKNGGIAKVWDNITYPLELNGQVYGTPENPVLQLRSNSGITFDLDAIRNAMPGRQVRAFRSTVGVSSNAEQVAKIETKEIDGKIVNIFTACQGKVGRAEVFVLVDGQLRQTASLTPDPKTIVNMDINLTPQDRFLTLVSTQGDNEWTHDWVMFAKPYLLLEPRE
jgi:hypothetical protein